MENCITLTESQFQAAVSSAASLALSFLNLDNRTQQAEDDMRKRYKVTLPSGETVWVSGNTVSEAFLSFANNYGAVPQAKVSPYVEDFIQGEYADGFMATLAKTTRQNYMNYTKYYIAPYFANKRMRQVTIADAQGFLDWMANGKSNGLAKNLTHQSIVRVRGFISRVFDIAKDMEYTDKNPFNSKLLRVSGEVDGHHVAMTDLDIDRVKRTLPTIKDPQVRLYHAMLAYTGMRREEVMGLHWEDIHIDEGYLDVKCTVTYSTMSQPQIKWCGKTASSIRPVLIPAPLRALIAPLQKDKGFVFSDEQGAPWCYKRLQRRDRVGRKLLGIEKYDNHDYRTTFATQLKETGMTSAQIADLMGHADTRMVERVYARSRREGIRKRSADIEALNKQYVDTGDT